MYVKSTCIYTNTQRNHKAQRLMKQTKTVTQGCNPDRQTCFFFFFLTDVIYVWASKPQRHN